jgi:pimeloyl-ACP methyl ester carboxylesterase
MHFWEGFALPRMSVIDAANLIRTAYAAPHTLPSVLELHISGADAYLLRDGTLVIPGTNQRTDWIRYNFQVHVQPGMRTPWLTMVPREQLKFYHLGFMRFAENLLKHLHHRRIDFIVGHSLGGAAAQILGCHLNVPAIAFGAPRTYTRRQRRHGESHVVCYCRADDNVGRVPTRFTGFRQLGAFHLLQPSRLNPGEDHRIDHYIEVLQDRRVMAGLETEWPRVA